MALVPGARLGPYEIGALIGVGGMGEVYRATDTNLKRAVAIKVLPGALAADADRLARFQREAEVLASLNHPNIAQIHGLEKSAGGTALVMELVEGPTLADRIAQGPIPLDETLEIARQMAEALEAAHERGIIHRDLKPANVKVRPDGTVKVLDFGLAKAMEPIGLSAVASQSPTITSPAMTQIGVLLGTAAYMSPEQARGKPVDKRADIWAFGCVLYEMLTGRRVFDGDEISDVLAYVLTKQPEWSALPSNVPTQIHRLLRRCLEKDLRRRLPDIAVARLEIDDAPTTPDVAVASGRGSGAAFGRPRLAWTLAVVFGLGLVAALGLILWRGAATTADAPSAVRLTFLLPDGSTVPPLSGTGYNYLAVSHDGRRIALVGNQNGQTRLWIRSLDTLEAQPLPGTEGALSPFWSPDDRSLGFFADGKLKKIDIGGGPPVTLCDAPDNRGGSWSSAGVILFSVGTAALQQVSAAGGVPMTVTTLAEGEFGHTRPRFLPDGRHYLFSPFGGSTDRAIYVGTLGTADRIRLLDSDSGQYFYSAGHLLFLRETTLMAQPFDQDRLELTGAPFPIADRILVLGNANLFAASNNGVLAYQTDAGVSGRTQLQWVDRAGKAISLLGEAANYTDVELSPDGTQAAVGILGPPNNTNDLWLYDVARGVRTRFTFDPANDASPVWSPDGSRIAFTSNRKGNPDIYEKPASGTGVDQPLLEADLFQRPSSWSRDGRLLLYQSTRTGGRTTELWVLPLDGDRKALPFLQTPFPILRARFSPDGRWVAHTSTESGREEVYVTPFPKAEGKWQISTAGGSLPRWRRDGKELFYVAPDTMLMAATVNGQGTGFQVGAVRSLFEVRRLTQDQYVYDVSADGQRFLINTYGQDPSIPITVVVNWTAGLGN